MLKRQRRDKKVAQWNNIRTTFNNRQHNQMVSRLSIRKSVNALHKVSNEKLILQSRKWEPEKFGKLIRNAEAVQSVIFDGILEDMHVEGIVKEEGTITKDQQCEGMHNETRHNDA